MNILPQGRGKRKLLKIAFPSNSSMKRLIFPSYCKKKSFVAILRPFLSYLFDAQECLQWATIVFKKMGKPLFYSISKNIEINGS